MMTVLLDTSFMVALLNEEHVAHHRVLPWQQQIVRGELRGILAAHSLAETYAVLTRLPLKPPIPPDLAWQAIERNLSVLQVIALTPDEYRSVLGELASQGIAGGPTYDALIAAVARKSSVDLLLTLNPAHFRRVAPDLADRIQEP
jgi:predicted nucleic acid-binding protein